MITVGVWGCGVVGSNTARMFKELGYKSVEVLEYDKYKEGSWSTETEIVEKSHFIFLCLPSPMNDYTGEVDLSYIEDALSKISESSNCNLSRQIIVLRSTVVPGTCDSFAEKYPNLEIAFMPEFLVESNPWANVINPQKVVFGAETTLVFESLSVLLKSVYPSNTVRFIRMSRAEAEMYKYACNTLLALNVAAANELYLICQHTGINYQNIQRWFKLDPRLGTHTKVPGPDGDLGFGGKCLVKDLNAICHFAEKNGVFPIVLKSSLQLNKAVRTNKDWENIPGAVSSCSYCDE